MVADRATQHRIANFQRIQHCAQGDRTGHLERCLIFNMRQGTQVRRKNYANHGSVCTSTDNTAGKSRTMGFQLSPASAEA